MNQIFGNIKKLRELRNLTQKYMAERLEMTQANYSRIESGEVDIPYSRIVQISQVLKIQPEDLISYDEKKVFHTFLDNVEKNTVGGDIIENKEYKELLGELKQQYEAHISAQDKEIERLHTLLEKSLTK